MSDRIMSFYGAKSAISMHHTMQEWLTSALRGLNGKLQATNYKSPREGIQHLLNTFIAFQHHTGHNEHIQSSSQRNGQESNPTDT